MTIEKFIKKHRKELLKFIHNKVGSSNYINTKEIKLWINNDESLYLWAKGEGVRFED